MRKDLGDMVVTISQMTDRSDLKVLNDALFRQFKYLQQLEAKKAKIKFKVGMPVSFHSKVSGKWLKKV